MNASTPLSNAARDKLARSGASNISNSLLKRGMRNTFLLGLQPLEPSQTPLVGPAFTMRFIPARNWATWRCTSETTACIGALSKNAPRTRCS